MIHFEVKDVSTALPVEAECVVATCGEKTNLLVQNRPRSEVISRVLSHHGDASLDIQARPSFNLVLIDALSRAHFLRTLPKTVQLLRSLAEKDDDGVEVFEFFRYHIVGSVTIANMPQMLGAYPADDVTYWSKGSQCAECDENWLNRRLKKRGYVTMESTERHNMFFHHKINAGDELGYDHFYDFSSCFLGYTEDPNTPVTALGRCMNNNESIDELTFKYTTQFLQNYAPLPRFSYTHIQTAHEPTFQVVQTLDEILPSHLNSIDLSSMFTFITADHGMSYGDFALSYYGQLEYKLPVLYLLAPSKFLTDEMRTNLKANSQSLVTGFDIYATINSLSSETDRVEPPQRPAGKEFTGIPLYERIPRERTCEEAGIQTKYCICTNWEEVSKFEQASHEVSNQVRRGVIKGIETINELAQATSSKLCSNIFASSFEVTHLERARIYGIGGQLDKKVPVSIHYRITISNKRPVERWDEHELSWQLTVSFNRVREDDPEMNPDCDILAVQRKSSFATKDKCLDSIFETLTYRPEYCVCRTSP